MANKTLYVGNLPYSITESDLTKEFSQYGATNSRIVEGRGFGFVDVDADKAEAAISEKNNTKLGDRTVTVNEARPKESRPSDNRGGGYSGGRSRSGNRW